MSYPRWIGRLAGILCKRKLVDKTEKQWRKDMEYVTLVSGHRMPMLGLGTWSLRGEACKQAVKKALRLGYTHIDTARMYENHRAIGDALQEVGADRSELPKSPAD